MSRNTAIFCTVAVVIVSLVAFDIARAFAPPAPPPTPEQLTCAERVYAECTRAEDWGCEASARSTCGIK